MKTKTEIRLEVEQLEERIAPSIGTKLRLATNAVTMMGRSRARSFRLMDANFGFLSSSFGNGEVIAVEVGAKETGAGSRRGGDLCNALILAG